MIYLSKQTSKSLFLTWHDIELHKPIISKFKKRKVKASFIDDIWGAVLADIQLISKFSKGCRFL